MLTLVIVTNPFSPQDGRTVSQIEYNGTLGELLKENTIDGVDMQATVNGYSVDNDYQIKNGDFVVIYPVVAKGGGKGGKSILGIVAAIALSVVSYGIASGGLLAGIGIQAGTFAAYAAATAVMFLGSSLMGRFMGQKVDVGNYDAENEPTYSWGGVQTMEGQNNAVSLTYGKVKSGGQTIGKFVSTEDNKEYLNWLIACGEGELIITDIKLNDNAVENYENVMCETRSGTNDQAVVPYFNDTYFTKNLSYHMTTVNTWYTDTAQGTATDGLIFKIELPNGLYHGNDHGKFSNNYVDITMQYKLTSSSTWITMAADRINGKSNKAIRKEYRVDNIPSGSYDVRMRVTTFGRDDATRDMHEIYWTGITSIVYDDFIYPCQALIGIRAKATDQLNGTPTLTFMKERSVVWVYNPYSDTYITKDATNPAWACYDFVHQARKLKNTNTNTMEIEVRGAAKELMRYDDFDAWATWCDEKDYHVNIEINNVGEVLELVNQRIAPIGHGLVVRFGTKYGCIYDHVQTPVQMFGMGNIISGTFQEEFLKVSDRANCVEITFTNKDAGYERDVLTIYGDTYDADGYTKTAQMTFDGITDYEQAYREGKYQLYSNKYLLRTVSFECGIDAIACTVGDVVMVSHDVPKWANSGRIYSINGATWVLPIELQDLTKSYRIQWRTVNDNLYTRACTIVSSADGWTTITVSGTIPSDDAPQVGDVFDIAIANIGSKPFVVKSITRAQDFTRSISCIEYNENVYNENYDIPVINYSQWYGEPKNVSNLTAVLTENTDNSGTAKLKCSWDVPDSGGTFTVLISTDGTTWRIVKTNLTGTSCEIDVEANTTYFVKVITLLGVNQSSGSVVGPIYPGGNTLPPATNLVGYTRYRGVKDGEYRYDIHLTWLPPVLSNYQTCDVWYKTNHRQTSQISMTEGVSVNEIGFTKDWEYAGNGYSDFVMNDVVYGDTYRFAVTTRDVLGNHNEPYADGVPTVDVTAAAKSTVPNTPDGFSIEFGEASVVSWKEVSNADIQFYEVRSDTNAGAETGCLLARVTGTSTSVPLTNRTGTLYLFAKSPLGRYSYPAILEYSKTAPPKPTAPTLTAKLGGFSLVAGAIPSGCNGMNIYIDGASLVSVHTVNNVYTYTCDAGIYDVSVAYTDLFGEGEHSLESRVTVKILVDAALLDAQAVTKDKLDSALKTAVDNANQSVTDITALRKSVGDNTAEIVKTNNSVTIVASRVDDNDDDIAALQVQADEISSAVFETTQSGTKVSRIAQNANGISAVVTNVQNINTNLNDSTKARQNYTAIQVMQDGIASKVAMGDVESYLQQDHTGFYIKGSLINIDGTTKIGNNVISKNMIQAGAVTADKMAVDSLSAITANVGSLKGGTITGTQIVGTNFKNSSGSFTVDDSGNVKGINITAGTVTADVIKQAGFKITAVTGLKGTMQASGTGNAARSWLTIPLPAGYGENECIWGAFPTVASTFALNGRKVRCYTAADDDDPNVLRSTNMVLDNWHKGD